MSKISNREKILTAGMEVVHAQGFRGASVRDIVHAAGVPQGSFTNHFPSKEAFGLEVLELYFANSRQTIARTLLADDLPPLQRLRAYVDANIDHIGLNGMRNGCLFGNFSAEIVDDSELIRHRLTEIFAEVQGSIEYCLKAAVEAGEISKAADTAALAGLIVSSLQGAILLAKTERSAAPVERFREMLFSMILR